MIHNITTITLSSYLGMFFLGVASSIVGAAARNIGLAPYQIGLMLAVQNIGFGISVLLSGALSDRYAKPRLLFAGSLILAVSFFSFYLVPTFWLNLIIMVFIGIGVGVYEGVTDALLLEIHNRRESLHISVNHFFVTLGAIVITTYLIFLQVDWRVSITQASIAVLVLAGLFGLTRVGAPSRGGESYLRRLQFLSRERVVIALFIGTVVAVGVETGTIGILTTYLMDLRSFTQVTSKIGLVVFLVGVASGRVLLGFASRKERIPQTILALFGLSTLSFSALYFLDFGWSTYIVIYGAGGTISALLPLMLSLAGLLYKELAGTVLGTIKVAIPVGGILIPFLMSLISRYASFGISLLVFPLGFLLAIGVLYPVFRSLKFSRATVAAEASD